MEYVSFLGSGLVTSRWWFYLLKKLCNSCCHLSVRVSVFPQRLLWGLLGPKDCHSNMTSACVASGSSEIALLPVWVWRFLGDQLLHQLREGLVALEGPERGQRRTCKTPNMPWTHQARSELSPPALQGLLEVLLVRLPQEALFHPAHRQLKLTKYSLLTYLAPCSWRTRTNLRPRWAVGSNHLSSLQKYNSLYHVDIGFLMATCTTLSGDGESWTTYKDAKMLPLC